MLILSEKNRQKLINMIRSEIKENQPPASIKLDKKLIKKLFLEKRTYFYIDVFGDGQSERYYIFKEDVFDIIKYIDLSEVDFRNIIIHDELKNKIIINKKQKEQSREKLEYLFGTSTEYISRVSRKSK